MVTMVRTRDLFPMIAAYVPDCPEFVAERAIRHAAITFCEVSRAWRHVTTHELAGGAHILVAPPFTAIHEIEYADWNGNRLTPVQFSTVKTQTAGQPRYITQVSPGEVALLPALGEGQPTGLEISVFLKPLATQSVGLDLLDPLHDVNDVIPDFLISIHGTTLGQGALALIYAIPKQPWTDEARATFYEAKFREGCNNRFTQNLRGQQRARLRTTSRWM